MHSEIFYDERAKKFREIDGRTIDALSVFKKGIRPVWEDPANDKGSDLIMRKMALQPDTIDTWWDNMVLGLIGETIEVADEICGCRIQDKTAMKGGGGKAMYRLELWMKKLTKEEGEAIHRRLCDTILDCDSMKQSPKHKPIAPEFDLNLVRRI